MGPSSKELARKSFNRISLVVQPEKRDPLSEYYGVKRDNKNMHLTWQCLVEFVVFHGLVNLQLALWT